jgi:RND family efflux transporter MFP subunit
MKATTRKVWWTAAACLPLLAATVALPGCEKAPAQSPQAAAKNPAVTVGYPEEAEVADYEEFTGRVDAANKVGIQAMVTGYLTKIGFKDGENVKKGDVLFEIDDSIYKAEFAKATAALTQALARAERLEGDFHRAKLLLADKSISREDFEKIAGDRLEAAAAVKVAEAQLQQADVNLKYTKVTSPITGRTSRRLIDVGNMVKANETMLTWVYQIDPMYGYFDVDERTNNKMRRLINEGKLKSYRHAQLLVEVGLADEEGYSIKDAYIDWVDNVLDSGTGTLKVRCVINQPRDPSTGEPMILVSPGMFVRVKQPVSPPHKVVLISEKAIGTDQGEKYVFVVNDKNVVERRNIQMGQMHHGLRVVELPSGEKGKGIKTTDKVIISGLQRVRPGATVDATVIPMPRALGYGQDVIAAAKPPNGHGNGNGKGSN